MRRWIVSVALAAVGINAVMSSSAYRSFSERPLHETARLFDRTALLLQGTSSLRRDRMASIEKIADLRPDDPLRVMAASTALLTTAFTDDKGKRHTLYCTTVLIAPQTLLTNHHCAYRSGKPYESAEVWFNYLAPETADVHPVGSILEADETLDFALLRITLPAGHAEQRSLPIATARSATPGERLVVIHHAFGDTQQISRAFCRVLIDQPTDKTQLRHSCPTRGGASGALLIAESDGAVVGLHHSNSTGPDALNGYATSFSAIMARITPSHLQ